MKFSTEVAVIGGGATGLGIAWDACLRGYKVLVFEKGDLAEGTSGRYHGLLHSGARYAVSDPASAADPGDLLRRRPADLQGRRPCGRLVRTKEVRPCASCRS